MMTIRKIKKGTLIALMALMATTAFAQRRHYSRIHYYGYHRPIVTTVVARPAVTTRTTNRLCKQDRLEMALAYLKNNPTLSVSQYSNMTGLPKATAEAELDAFTICKKNPIRMVGNGKKKHYVLA